LVYDEDLFEAHADGHLRIRVRWLEARIAAAIGDPEEAERSLLVVRDHFAGQGHGFNAAIACLDLAALYHQEGRFEELREAAGQAVQLFQTHEIHRDALAALLLLQEAITARRLTAETIQRVAAYLQEAQRDPTARFEKPN
jgi:soluble cytochrome b562